MAAGSAEELEEERRLLYVAMARARDHLHLGILNASSGSSKRGVVMGTTTPS
jgi:ATP-dependent exoDNAse (exonuclease V) beta subunit